MKVEDTKTKTDARNEKTVSLKTPQQDEDWSEDRKVEWIKNETSKLLKTFNAKESA